MMSRGYSLLFASFLVSGLAMAMAVDSNQPTFHRHFWSNSDKHHYKLSDDGELAQLVLDEKSGSSHIFPLFFSDQANLWSSSSEGSLHISSPTVLGSVAQAFVVHRPSPSDLVLGNPLGDSPSNSKQLVNEFISLFDLHFLYILLFRECMSFSAQELF